jgi:hypothetical protein
MSTKREGVPCYDKAKENEELFCLRAQDVTAPAAIVAWIGLNITSAPSAKLRDALECALRMRGQVASGAVHSKAAD